MSAADAPLAAPASSRPIGFAHRGARADAPENTLAAFRLALELGANGLETDVWLTADGVPVLHHGGAVRFRRLARAVPIGRLAAVDLPGWLPSLADLLSECGSAYDLSLDLKDVRSAEAVLAVVRSQGADPARLWLCGRGLAPLHWRALDPDVRLVSDTRRRHLGEGWGAHLRRLADGGVDAVNLRHRRWSGQLVRQVHDAGLLAFGWDAQTTARLTELLRLGCDAVYSDHVRRMAMVLQQHPAGT